MYRPSLCCKSPSLCKCAVLWDGLARCPKSHLVGEIYVQTLEVIKSESEASYRTDLSSDSVVVTSQPNNQIHHLPPGNISRLYRLLYCVTAPAAHICMLSFVTYSTFIIYCLFVIVWKSQVNMWMCPWQTLEEESSLIGNQFRDVCVRM